MEMLDWKKKDMKPVEYDRESNNKKPSIRVSH